MINRSLIQQLWRDRWRRVSLSFIQWGHECSNHDIQRGDHNIEDEMIFRSNPGFIFHDSRGFESGSVKELELMKKFLADRTSETRLERRLHVIW